MFVQQISGNEARIVLDQELDQHNSREFRQIVQELTTQGIKLVRLDLGQTRVIDSAGLAKLLFAQELLTQNSGEVCLTNLQDNQLREMLLLIRLDQVIRLV